MLYAALAWYLTLVLPSEYGTPLPFYFPLTRQYWCPARSDSTSEMVSLLDERATSPLLEDDAVRIFEMALTRRPSLTLSSRVGRL